MYKICIAFILIFTLNIQSLQAQTNTMDFLRSTGKIYTVIVVIVVLFIGIVVFLKSIDNKLTKLENLIKNEQ
ncbi:MAG: CcmD family protein [Saprospiraceae bacterium]